MLMKNVFFTKCDHFSIKHRLEKCVCRLQVWTMRRVLLVPESTSKQSWSAPKTYLKHAETRCVRLRWRSWRPESRRLAITNSASASTSVWTASGSSTKKLPSVFVIIVIVIITEGFNVAEIISIISMAHAVCKKRRNAEKRRQLHFVPFGERIPHFWKTRRGNLAVPISYTF